MATDSVRFHRHDLHQHEEDLVPKQPGSPPPPPACIPESCATEDPQIRRLWRDGDMVMYQANSEEPVAVRILWAKPLSERGGPVSIMTAGKKKEVAFLSSLDLLPEDSRKIAIEELAGNMILARITAIHAVKPRFGNYYWNVETDRGLRRFLLTSPENNYMQPRPDTLVIRDTSGNCYEINPVSGLDRKSLRELDRVF